MKKIITVFALLSLLSCEKETPPAEAKQTTTATTYDDKVFYFAQDMAGLGQCNLQFEDLDGNAIESLHNYVNPCQDVFYTLVDDESYRIKFWSRNTAQQYVHLQFEAVLTYENGELTINKTAGNYNMFYSDDCGMFKHLVK